MNFIRHYTAAALMCIAAAPALAAEPATKEDARAIEATAILNEWQQIPDLVIPDRLLERAQAIAVFPGVIKGAFWFGGRYGKGIVTVRDLQGHWSNPAFLSVGGGSWGLQFGVQSADIILVFTTRKGIEGLSGGKVTVGGDVSGAVGPVGRQMSGATDLSFSAEVYSYSRAKGLFAGIALDGSSMNIDHTANSRYYRHDEVLASDIFANKVGPAPASGQAFVAAVQHLVSGGGAAAETVPATAAGATTPVARPDDKGLESGGAATFPLDPPK